MFVPFHSLHGHAVTTEITKELFREEETTKWMESVIMLERYLHSLVHSVFSFNIRTGHKCTDSDICGANDAGRQLKMNKTCV